MSILLRLVACAGMLYGLEPHYSVVLQNYIYWELRSLYTSASCRLAGPICSMGAVCKGGGQGSSYILQHFCYGSIIFFVMSINYHDDCISNGFQPGNTVQADIFCVWLSQKLFHIVVSIQKWRHSEERLFTYILGRSDRTTHVHVNQYILGVCN